MGIIRAAELKVGGPAAPDAGASQYLLSLRGEYPTFRCYDRSVH
jgi:hypothetical protein